MTYVLPQAESAFGSKPCRAATYLQVRQVREVIEDPLRQSGEVVGVQGPFFSCR